MKKTFIILSLSLALIMAAGCTASNAGVPGPSKEPLNGAGFEPIDPEILSTALPANVGVDMAAKYWEEISVGGSNERPVSWELFTDYAAFRDAFGDYGLQRKYTEKTFEEVFLVAVHIYAPTGGWAFELKEGVIKNGSVTVRIEGVKPSGMVTQAFEEHLMLIAFDRSAFRENMSFNIDAPSFTKKVDEK